MTPIDIKWHSAGMHQVDPSAAWEDTALRSRLAMMKYPKRRSEARLGRWTAKAAVAMAVGLDADDAETLHRIMVRNAPDGAPEVEVDGAHAGLTIAMTDRADWAVCAVVEGPTRVGCDLELVEPRSPAFVGDYFTAHEQALVRHAANPELSGNLVWSAKESALKVLRTGLRRPAKSVEVHLTDGDGNGWSALTVHDSDTGRTFPGWWIRYGEFVLTIAASSDSRHPLSFDQPPPLASATPAHSWISEISSWKG